ncbi:MAG: hypothetical protein MPK09_01960 [Gammaproteobacteria bacterium]|nr:hypothetical protein [Gammaproteobacteria bacterium]
MTSKLEERAFGLLSFSRRMQTLGLIETDLPKLPWACVRNLTDAIGSSIDRIADENTDDFWVEFAEKCDAAGLAEKSGVFRPATFLNGEVTRLIREKRMEGINVLEFMFRTPGMPENLAQNIKKSLESSEYCIDDSKNPVCVQWSALLDNS